MEKQTNEVVCNRPDCNRKGQTLDEFLSCYNPDKYKKPSVTVDMLIFYEKEQTLELLLIQRADHPFLNQWALPGGFVNMDENLEEAAMRELEEETHLKEAYLEQLYTYGDVDRDPRGRTISVAYVAVLEEKDKNIRADDDAKAAKWFMLSCRKQTDLTNEINTNEINTNEINTNQINTNQINTNDIKANNTKVIEDKENPDKENLAKETKYQTSTIYEINLESKNTKLYAKLKHTISYHRRWKTESIEVLDSENIAFDHAKIILKGYLKISEALF